MQDAEVEVLLLCEVSHTRHKRLPQRPITGPCGKDFIDGRIVNGWLALGIVRDGQALPLHARIQDPQDEVKDAMIAQFALGTPLGIERCGKRNAVNSLSESWTGIGVVAGFAAVRLILEGPHVKDITAHW
jgi:hypothetical protein